MIASSILPRTTSPKRERGLSAHPSLALRAGRPALTLLEVLIALAIFLLAMVVFGEMIIRNGEITRQIQWQNLATRLCQSKMSEVVAGVVPLTSQDDTPFDEDPDYTWSLEADNGTVDGLWNVTVTVKRATADTAAPVQCSLMQMVLDPSIVGTTQDVTPVTSSTASSTSSASSGSSSGSSMSSTTASQSSTGR